MFSQSTRAQGEEADTHSATTARLLRAGTVVGVRLALTVIVVVGVAGSARWGGVGTQRLVRYVVRGGQDAAVALRVKLELGAQALRDRAVATAATRGSQPPDDLIAAARFGAGTDSQGDQGEQAESEPGEGGPRRGCHR